MTNFRGISLSLAALTGLFCVASLPASAAAVTIINITINELGNGVLTSSLAPGINSPMSFSFITDPGPGGLAGVGNYSMLGPPSLVAGDVQLGEPGFLSDVLRFDPTVGNGSIFFYSDLDGGADTIVDKGLPTASSTNIVVLNEVNLGGGVFGAQYTPTSGQPGFVSGFQVNYTFISDTPEPATAEMLLCGFAAIALIVRRQRLAKSA